jgi:hypothetical protein
MADKYIIFCLGLLIGYGIRCCVQIYWNCKILKVIDETRDKISRNDNGRFLNGRDV